MGERSSYLYITGLAMAFTIALTFLTLEIPLYLNRLLRDWLNTPDYNPAITPDLIEEFIVKNNLRPIGYGCLALMIVLVVIGFITSKSRVVVLGSAMLFLPTFGYFVSYMFFLSGLGILRLIWIPLWGVSLDLLRLGDIVYLPYMLVTYPLSLILSIFTLDINMPFFRFLAENRMIHFYLGGLHLDPRTPFALMLIIIGLLVFMLGTVTWLITHYRGNLIANFWLYRYSRHPQYLGWILWSYGVMLLASLTPVVRGGVNPGASLPWMLSSLIVVCVALNEEAQMVKTGEEYIKYRERTPFMIPLPKFLVSIIQLPFRLVVKKSRPENTREVFMVFLLYSAILILLSLPFIMLSWPSSIGWSEWPFTLWPFSGIVDIF